ncbi:hypothetical protein PFMALIP_05686 [Plasmodium falciparum MaliPS096_E11]|nr:hypothetical protein PFMALIP_05686 [Plasmodium falciparum MaliPS096_E11]
MSNNTSHGMSNNTSHGMSNNTSHSMNNTSHSMNNTSHSMNNPSHHINHSSHNVMNKNCGNKRNYTSNNSGDYNESVKSNNYYNHAGNNTNYYNSNKNSISSENLNKQIKKGAEGGDADNVRYSIDKTEEVEKKNPNMINIEMLNPEDRKKEAEKYKVLGNQSYKLGYFESAIDYYTKAIQYDNTNHVYYTNRALCYKKQKLWKLANMDARQALNLEEESVKAHFILGLTLLHLNSLEEGLKKLTKAKTLSSYLKDSNESEINRYIMQAKKLIYLRDEQNKQLSYTELQSFFIDKINLLNQIGYITNEEKSLRIQQTEGIFKELLDSFQKKQVPDYLCCKISMCLMNEPVITPSGMTYDKIFLYEHVKHNGSFDPVSREQFSIREVIPNYAIKEATEHFLKANPWAFEE